MNDTAIKNYAMWARRELIAGVLACCARYGIAVGADPHADSIDGRVLSSVEKNQRRILLEQVKSDGLEQLAEKAAYTWFNRLLAIRFMEVNDRLPSHVRVLSAQDGSFKPQALDEAMDLPLEALDARRAAELVQAGDDEALFRLVFLAQCSELAACMPAVFEKVGSAMELLLPDGLLRQGGVVEKLVSSIPEADWREGVEIVGWMYQYYVSERKDEVFASFKKGKKAERDSIAPATQLFTPNWIVRYLTENSLGRLWMLNFPESRLPEQMPYFVRPDGDCETEFKRVASPEEITVVDPACGSGHILVYAFELLEAMYAEAGYSNRDAATLILQKNVSGMEIDPRAAAMASFCLTMKACELDSRFLRRGVSPRITVLSRVEFEGEEKALMPKVRNNLALLDAATHLDECGSLFKPSKEDMADIAGDLASLAEEGSLFAATAMEKLEQLQVELQPLAERYDVVVANPPYMGGSNMNKWISAWVKDNYANAKRDLCTCFIDRGFSFANGHGHISMITASSWMFISSFEEFRKSLLRRSSITSMIQQSTHGYAGVTVPTTMFVLAEGAQGVTGTYIRLEDFDRPQWQEPRALEALADPNCGWRFERKSTSFEVIPGTPIAYWISEKAANLFTGKHISDFGFAGIGMRTGDNARFLRYWYEVSDSKAGYGIEDAKSQIDSGSKWIPYNKGGEFRKWYGNNEYLVNWLNNGEEIKENTRRVYPELGDDLGWKISNEAYYFLPGITWTGVTSGAFHCRCYESGFIFDSGANGLFAFNPSDRHYIAGLLNTNMANAFLKVLNPTINCGAGTMRQVPVIYDESSCENVREIVEDNVQMSKSDWDSFETSWDFRRHPLI